MEQLVRRRHGGLLSLLMVFLALGVLVAGCERRAQDAPEAGTPSAELVATADYGDEVLLEARVAPGQSVMRALRGATEVQTAHGGGFVAGMLGRESDASGGRDWFVYPNGVAASVGADQIELADGDTVWWDYRRWTELPQVHAVVGLWPAPFAHPGGRGPRVSADPPLRRALADAGARLMEGEAPWRVRVGASQELARRDAAWRRALRNPDGAGLTVTVRDGRIVAMDAEAGERRPVDGARALLAAVPTGASPGDGALLAVVGLDAAAAQAAAERLASDPSVVRLRYAVALDGEGTPIQAGARSGP
jgi:hypothetical protein